MHYRMKTSQLIQCDDLNNVQLESLGPGIHVNVTFDMYQLPKHYYRPGTLLHGNSIQEQWPLLRSKSLRNIPRHKPDK